MRKIETDPEVLVHAISDAINVYMRDVLRPRGLIPSDIPIDVDDELLRLKYEIAQTVAESWKVSWINDDA
jgi:hypothetical protein